MSDFVKHYDALLMRQTAEGKPLLLFAAPAVDISEWSGVPQRKRLDGQESAGFQRDQDPDRIDELLKFYDSRKNIIQNPLLGALQDGTKVTFAPQSENSPFGKVSITFEDYSSLPMLTILRRLVAQLESRFDTLTDAAVDEARVSEIMRREMVTGSDADLDEDTLDEDTASGMGDESESDSEATASIMLAEETHILDFYTELKARIRILEHRGIDDAESIQGFTKSALVGYIKPVVLVDGQHRLAGALKSAYREVKSDAGQEHILDLVRTQQATPERAERDLLASASRQLPVSLLMDDSPSEHVFQFVVVNQKATPMGKALLGTIVSTSLSRNELEEVAQRLRGAGIKLEDSQAVAYLTRAADSPFRGLVQTGMPGDRPDLLQWTVLRGLVSIFRELKGGKPYHAKVDYAKAWRQEYFPQCGLVTSDGSDEERIDEWSQPDGPWREIFIRFFVRVRDYFGNSSELGQFNSWGSTAVSNLFNKVSLTILASDYFDFLYTKGSSLSSYDEFEETLDEWLKNGKVSDSYFNRDWRLSGVKKDLLTVRQRWSQNWQEYRKVPSNGLPLPRSYRP